MKIRLIELIDENTPIALTEAEVRILARPKVTGALATTVTPPAVQFMGVSGQYRGSASSDPGVLRLRVSSARLVESRLNPGDERKFLSKLQGEVLAATLFPEIRFSCTKVDSVPPEDWGGLPGPNPRYIKDPGARLTSEQEDLLIRGTLEIRGNRHSIELRFRQQYRSVYRCETEVDLRDYGIQPPRAFMGALKVEQRVPVSIELDLRAALHVSEQDFGAESPQS